jgi:hypothetical protein
MAPAEASARTYGSFDGDHRRRLPNMSAVALSPPILAIAAPTFTAVKHQLLAFDLSDLRLVVVHISGQMRQAAMRCSPAALRTSLADLMKRRRNG